MELKRIRIWSQVGYLPGFLGLQLGWPFYLGCHFFFVQRGHFEVLHILRGDEVLDVDIDRNAVVVIVWKDGLLGVLLFGMAMGRVIMAGVFGAGFGGLFVFGDVISDAAETGWLGVEFVGVILGFVFAPK